jgi:hypothetical protein
MARHFCHAIDCPVTVPPRMHMCRAHWFRLPKQLRDAVWAAYQPGQEITKNPSPAYLAATDATIGYIADLEGKPRPKRAASLPFLATNPVTTP